MKVDEIEREFVGGCLAFPDRIGTVADLLTPEDFYSPLPRAVWGSLLEMFRDGLTIDLLSVAVKVGRTKDEMLGIMLGAPTGPQPVHAEFIAEEAFRRRLRTLARDVDVRTQNPALRPADLADEWITALSQRRESGATESLPVEDFMDGASGSSPWVVPGLLRKDWRCVIVAAEGAGKSVLLRQICLLAAQGVHPLWQAQEIPPVRTLIVDLENPAAAVAETGQRIVARLKTRPGHDRCRSHIWSRPGGIDLRSPTGAGALEREVRRFAPDLVAMGPLYKATTQRSRESHEDVAAGLQALLDDLRTRYGFALLLEHHAPQDERGSRTMRPYGSSLWLRWPEFGIGIDDELALKRWRGDRLQGAWPNSLERSNVWPFIGKWDKGFSTGEPEEEF